MFAADGYSRRLEQEVDQIISAAVKVGRRGQITASVNGRAREFIVDRIVCDDYGYPSEVWLSTPFEGNMFRRLIDRIRGVHRRDLMRLMRIGGDVRRTLTTIEVAWDGVTHIGFREEIGAPRLSCSVATFRHPRSDAADWLHTYRRAS